MLVCQDSQQIIRFLLWHSPSHRRPSPVYPRQLYVPPPQSPRDVRLCRARILLLGFLSATTFNPLLVRLLLVSGRAIPVRTHPFMDIYSCPLNISNIILLLSFYPVLPFERCCSATPKGKHIPMIISHLRTILIIINSLVITCPGRCKNLSSVMRCNTVAADCVLLYYPLKSTSDYAIQTQQPQTRHIPDM